MDKIGEVEKLIAEILRASPAPATPIASELRQVVERDYAKALKTFFSAREARQLFRIFMRELPWLNRSITGQPNRKYVKNLTGLVGTDLEAIPFGQERRNLRGFYIPEDKKLGSRPTIYLNMDLHPIMVTATAYHEVAHHITESKIAPAHRPAVVTFANDYTSHLTDPFELLADAVVTLAAYPNNRAKELFQPTRGSKDAQVVLMVTNASEYMKELWNLDLAGKMPEDDRIHHVAAILHFIKLRCALLTEFDL